MNIALNRSAPENHLCAFHSRSHLLDVEGSTEAINISRQKYFSICIALPDIASGNRFPYGVCGPFLDENEALGALQALQAKMPNRKLGVMYGQNFCEPPDMGLELDQELARARLLALLTAE